MSTSTTGKRRREEEEDQAVASSDDEEVAAAAATAAEEHEQGGNAAATAAASAAAASAAAAASSGKGGEEAAADGDAAGDQKEGGGGGASSGSGAGSSSGGAAAKNGGGSSSKYKYAVVCSSNVNRSMEAHVALFNNRMRVGSYGAGRFVRLPAPGGPEGRTFEFGTPYETMVTELTAKADGKAMDFYKRTKLLDILRRNKQIKRAPERWQDLEADAVADYDVVVCYEQRIYDAVVEDLLGRESRDLEPICVICMETKDDPKEAIIAGRATVKLSQQLEECEDLANEAPDVVDRFQAAEGRRLLFQVHYL